jgi:hypothetical protein
MKSRRLMIFPPGRGPGRPCCGTGHLQASTVQCDGEAVLLALDGVSDFDGLHSRKHNDEVQLYASIFWRWTARTCGSSRCTFERTISPGCWRGGRRAYS